jgi:hypothetical protein
LLAGTLIIQTTPEFTEAYNIYMDNYSAILQSGYSGANVGDLFAGMSSTNLLYFAVPYILGAIRFAIMLICGFRTNRMYFKHCIKKISSIKNYASSFDKESDEEAATTKSKINEQIENKGGVNLAIAVVATFVFLAIALKYGRVIIHINVICLCKFRCGLYNKCACKQSYHDYRYNNADCVHFPVKHICTG